MAFVSALSIISERRKTSSRTGPRPSEDAVVLATDLSKRGDAFSFSVRLTLSKKIVSEARLIPGDCVDVLFDRESNRGLIKRVKDGCGWKLTAAHQKAARLNVKFTWVEGLPTFKHSVGVDAVVTDEGVLFDIPPEAQWEGNAREDRIPFRVTKGFASNTSAH